MKNYLSFFFLIFSYYSVAQAMDVPPPIVSSHIHEMDRETHDKLPTELKEKYPVGKKIAVLAGTRFSGYGLLGKGFTTINKEETLKEWGIHKVKEHYYELYNTLKNKGITQVPHPDIMGDFNHPEQFSKFENAFDIVIIEGPGPENQFNSNMYKTAFLLTKPGGRIDLSIYRTILVTSKLKSSEELESAVIERLSIAGGYLNEFLIPANIFYLHYLAKYITVNPLESTIQDGIYFERIRSTAREKGIKLFNASGFKKIICWDPPKEIQFATLPHFYCSFIKSK
jgi:hypothetical protein